MSVSLQNLRSLTPGTKPSALLPGQLCFNLPDKILYLGDGSSTKTYFDGSSTSAPPGGGWFEMPMNFNNFGNYFLGNPQFWGDTPSDGQILGWNQAEGHPVWVDYGGYDVFILTNSAVAAAPGLTTSEKITAAIGSPSINYGDVCIVTGSPGEEYQGLYFYSSQWVKGASFAYPTASQVTYNNTVTGILATNVQEAIDDLWLETQDALLAANNAQAAADNAQTTADSALPKSGGTMTGFIAFDAGQPVDAGVF